MKAYRVHKRKVPMVDAQYIQTEQLKKTIPSHSPKREEIFRSINAEQNKQPNNFISYGLTHTIEKSPHNGASNLSKLQISNSFKTKTPLGLESQQNDEGISPKFIVKLKRRPVVCNRQTASRENKGNMEATGQEIHIKKKFNKFTMESIEYEKHLHSTLPDKTQQRAYSSVDTRAIQVFTRKKINKEEKSPRIVPQEIASTIEMIRPTLQNQILLKQKRAISTSPARHTNENKRSITLFNNKYAENNYSTNALTAELNAFSFPLSNLYGQTFHRIKKHNCPETASQTINKKSTDSRASHKMNSGVVIEDYEYNKLNQIARYLERVAQRRAMISDKLIKATTQPMSPENPKLYSIVCH